MDLFMHNVPFNFVSTMEDLVMTSDTAKKGAQQSEARKLLDLVTSDHQVNLSGFTPQELNEFLQCWLNKLDPRELRGFTELKKTLCDGGQQPFSAASTVVDDVEIVLSSGFDGPFNLKTHTMRAYRGAVAINSTWRRHESTDETTDRDVASSWGRQGYVYRQEETIFLLRRQRNHSYGDKNLILATCHHQKVPRKDHYLIHKIVAEQVLTDSFSERFGKKAPDIAVMLIWSLRDIVSRTHSALVSTADAMKRSLNEWEQIAKVIS